MDLSDAEIVRLVLAGDTELFGCLVDRYHARHSRFAIHMLGDREEAADAMQEAFLRAYRALPSYEERERFGAWLLRIVVNQCRTAIASRRRRVGLRDLLAAFVPSEPAGMADRVEARQDLTRALVRIPEGQREAILLRYVDDMSYVEMASVTGASVSALKLRVLRGCEHLRELLTEVHQDDRTR
jgi:RNA polymerase sigma-70 factor (ECF subfamily)